MKNFVFAIQVFGIMAMLPILVVLEINHGTQTLPVTIQKQSVSKTNGILIAATAIAGLPMTAFAFSRSNRATDHQCSNEDCKCQSCTCGSTCTCKDL
jgi:uncharacterized membrane protein